MDKKMDMKKTLLIPPMIMDIILLPAMLFSLFPYVLEAMFQTALLKPFVILGVGMLVIFSYLKPWFWCIAISIYYILCMRYAMKQRTSVRLFVILLTAFCLIGIYGTITAHELIDAIIHF